VVVLRPDICYGRQTSVRKEALLERLCVFCGSSPGDNSAYRRAAEELGTALCERNITLVYGGSKSGTMGNLARQVLNCGGRAIGVIPKMLLAHEQAFIGLSELKIVDTMQSRKSLMAELSDGFLALPGGFGTLDEVSEMLAWSQLGIHEKPVGLLNVSGYFNQLKGFFDHMVSEGFLSGSHRSRVLMAGNADKLLDRMAGLEHADDIRHQEALKSR
jgi:uncharacterized protein (TIGR00730 family)